MFGISFGELILIGAITLMVVGPDKLPKMLATLGRWTGKLRRITTEVRHQTGIDELLRQEGLKGGLNELRGLVRNDFSTVSRLAASTVSKTQPKPNSATSKSTVAVNSNLDPYENVPHDRTREYPPEGCDAYNCLPDDLWNDPDAEDDEVVEKNADPTAAEGSTETSKETSQAQPEAKDHEASPRHAEEQEAPVSPHRQDDTSSLSPPRSSAGGHT